MSAVLDKWQQRATAVEQSNAEKRAAQAQRNRKLMPVVTAFVDELRAIFGEGVKVTYAHEGAQEFGQRLPAGVVPVFEHVTPKRLTRSAARYKDKSDGEEAMLFEEAV